jgi:surfeit locus 1 family protein
VLIRIASRSFAPRWFTTLLTIVLMATLIDLGFWQLHRAEEKRVLYDAFAAGNDIARSMDGQTPKLRRYSHVEADGHYDSARQILIDNMVDAAGAGYYVITPFALQGGGWVLVNRGWVPLGKSRTARPEIEVADNARHIRGRADNMPVAGIQMGVPAPLAPPYPIVAAFPKHAELALLLKESNWTPATDLVLLDADQPDGFVRHWAPPGFPPLRHTGYALQWFALALALFVIYVVTNFRRVEAAV